IEPYHPFSISELPVAIICYVLLVSSLVGKQSVRLTFKLDATNIRCLQGLPVLLSGHEQVVTAQRQCTEPPSPNPSDSESLSDTNPPLSTLSAPSSTLPPFKSNTVSNNKIQSLDPLRYKYNKDPVTIAYHYYCALVASSSRSSSKTKTSLLSASQSNLLPTVKYILFSLTKSISTLFASPPAESSNQSNHTDISAEELENELVAHNFEVQLIKRFGLVDKPQKNISKCTNPLCANCNGAHTTNFCGCPSFSEIAKNFTTKSSMPNNQLSSKSTYPQILPQNNATPQTQPPPPMLPKTNPQSKPTRSSIT
ncbi:Uncharacterized protein FWK35_00024774, partial [Aphis craccivora]